MPTVLPAVLPAPASDPAVAPEPRCRCGCISEQHAYDGDLECLNTRCPTDCTGYEPAPQ
jgi:hypothetical protein